MLTVITYVDGHLNITDHLEEEFNHDEVKNPLWIDATNLTKAEAALLQEKFGLHPLTIEDLLHARTRIKVEQFNNYLFCVFYALKKDHGIRPAEIDFVVSRKYIITSHLGMLQFIKEIQENHEKLEKTFVRGMDFLFHHILDVSIDTFFPVLEYLDRDIEQVDEMITKKASPEALERIMELKKGVVDIKRVALPQREKVSLLTKNEHEQISRRALPYFRDLYDHSVRVYETIENCRESVSASYDLYMSTMSHNMNEVMKVLSIMATIALPLTVLSGIFGTNFAVLPGASSRYGFWIMIVIMVGMVGSMIIYFRRRGWF
ncbi:magnesium/cobalt transporter CorA [Candidatus Woesearchaeota archaeon]|nr:magnesium/cobalt transporter CorA [Candidatus Woesearchaeota archaeon]